MSSLKTINYHFDFKVLKCLYQAFSFSDIFAEGDYEAIDEVKLNVSEALGLIRDIHEDSPDAQRILDLCIHNFEEILRTLDGDAILEEAEAIKQTLNISMQVLAATGVSLENGSLENFIRTLSGKAAFILSANCLLSKVVNNFFKACKGTDMGCFHYIMPTGLAIHNNVVYVINLLRQRAGLDAEELQEYHPTKGIIDLLRIVTHLMKDEAKGNGWNKSKVMCLMVESLLSLARSADIAETSDASLDKPVNGVLPLTLYSFEHIRECLDGNNV